MAIANHHLETLQRDKIKKKNGETRERRTRCVLEGDSTRQGDIETACRDLSPTMGHYGCTMIMMMMMLFLRIQIGREQLTKCRQLHLTDNGG